LGKFDIEVDIEFYEYRLWTFGVHCYEPDVDFRLYGYRASTFSI